jgi:uncharacterized membrane protein
VDSERTQKATTIELDRLVFFSDAIFAIAITLLVLELRVPDRTSLDPDAVLASGLLRMIPRFASFAVSYWIIAIYWFSHHRMFRFVRRWDERLIWLNLLFMFWIVFLPFPTAMLGSFGDRRLAVIFYAAALTVTGMSSALLWRYVSRDHRLIDRTVSMEMIRYVTARSLVTPLCFGFSIVLAICFPPIAAQICWYLIFPALAIVKRRYGAAAETAVQ